MWRYVYINQYDFSKLFVFNYLYSSTAIHFETLYPNVLLTMPITRFDEVAEELFKLTKEVERLQKQLNEEREQRLRMEEAFSERLQKIEQAIDSLSSNK